VPEPVESREPVPSEPPDTRVAERDEPPEPGPWVPRATLGVAAGIAGGLLPLPGVTIEGAAGVRVRWLSVAAIGTHRFGRERGLEPRGSIVLSGWSAGALACGWPRVGRIELPVCAVAEAGQVVGQGRGLEPRRTARRPWVGVGLRAGVAFAIVPRVAVWVAGQGTALALRPRFHVEGIGTVHTAAPVVGRGLFGVEVRLR
jgi:hypothetical protein